MSSRGSPEGAAVGDLLALTIQELHSQNRLRGEQPLLRIDQRKEAAEAPYQFDTARGRLHRRGCRAIPASSRSALYGVWQIGSAQQKLACPRCKPVAKKEKTGKAERQASSVPDTFSSDLFYGVVSILDQFAGVLRERGREYRESQDGQQLHTGVEGLYERLGDGEKEILNVVTSTLDGLVKRVQDLHQNINGRNGHNGHNSRDGHNGQHGSRRRK